MTLLIKQEHFAEQEILNNLRSPVRILRMRGEEQLFKNYSYFMRVGINKYPLCEDCLSDAYSDTILAAIDTITNRTFQEKSSLKTFLFQIFKNKCIDALRKKAARRNSVHKTLAIDSVQMLVSDPSQSVIEKLIETAEIDKLKQQFKKLCDKKQRLLQLLAEGYTDKEIAVEMNFKTRSVVKTCRLRCIHSLRKFKNAG
jgi:RNA polymerase sigma-70 factor (ECF subfamily)